MECFYGPDQTRRFARTDILVNTLAVIPETTNIINDAAPPSGSPDHGDTRKYPLLLAADREREY